MAAIPHRTRIALGRAMALKSRRLDAVDGRDADVRRKLPLMKNALTTPGPPDPHKTAELARSGASMEALYGAGKFTDRQGRALNINDAARIGRTSRDPRELLETWSGWHSVARPMKADYARLVALTNQGARRLGYTDAGALLRSKDYMPPDAFAAAIDR